MQGICDGLAFGIGCVARVSFTVNDTAICSVRPALRLPALFHWSLDGKSLGILRGHSDSDVVLLQESKL
jgi:hypothetical protein